MTNYAIENSESSSKLFVVAGMALMAVFFVGAVFIAGWTVNVSYRSSQLASREKTALTKQKVLKEQLAQLNSLQVALAYARDNGYTPMTVTDTLHISTPVAQNTLVQ